MRNLNYQLKQLCDRNRDGSHATRNDRERILTLVANQLRELGYRHLQADSLKPKHVEALLARWPSEAIATGTVKNRMSALRWWAEKVDKQNVIAKSNDAYGIAERVHVANVSKAKTLDAPTSSRMSPIPTRPRRCVWKPPLGWGADMDRSPPILPPFFAAGFRNPMLCGRKA
ncbi:MAG: phage integrase N-terminal domain-containing protein [Thiobacillaceae bacterium]